VFMENGSDLILIWGRPVLGPRCVPVHPHVLNSEVL